MIERSVLFSWLLMLIIFSGCKDNGLELKDTSREISYNFDVRPILSDKCFVCHGPDEAKQEAGLRLDIREYALAPLKETKDAFAIIPGDPQNSELMKRVRSEDPAYMMPTPQSHLNRLTNEEVNILSKWIEQGAQYEKHWAFIKPVKNDLPEVRNEDWCQNEIDYFVLDQLEKINLKPNPKAKKEFLLKRVSMDLIGILPEVELQDQFLEDEIQYNQIVEQLLESEHYGERMAVLWLDLARYSDSFGYQNDNIRSQWPFRDWVIKAFNENMLYDQFVTWQLAGDMLPDVNKEKILATAFLRNHKYTEESGVIPEEYRVEYIFDKVKTYTKSFLGITMECAQCHDHKYDPLSQKEYFEMFAFFNNTPEKGFEGGSVGSGYQAKTPILEITPEDVDSVLSFLKDYVEKPMGVSVMDELEDTIRPTFILGRGVYDNPTEQVYPNVPRAIMEMDSTKFPRNRLGLAQWTFDADNPLTARVFVNLIWQELFGRGLVNTSGDFGMQGELPSHPELLDWLAVDFIENNWDIHYLLKKIVNSATYQQSAKLTDQHTKIDPDNIYLARSPRVRLKSETIKDIVMQTSGLLHQEIGGPSVKPYQPEGIWELSSSGRGELKTYKQDKGNKLYRKGIYTFIKLTVPPPSMILFDASNRDQCEVKRLRTNTPLQALIMMNDPMILEASRVLAQNLYKQSFDSSSDRLVYAFRKILCRMPSDKEFEILRGFYEDEIAHFDQNQVAAEEILNIGEFDVSQLTNLVEEAALAKTIALIYNMEESLMKT